MDDWNHLTAFAASGDEQAFGAVVKQHVGLVYTAAQRQLSDKELVEDVVQSTFILLAKKARTLKPEGSLGAWLYRAAHNKAREHQKSETRRKCREKEATMDENLSNQEPTVDWSIIAPVLDEAMAALGHKDRSAVIMRFFEGRPLKEVGEALGVSEDAAQKRVSRALARLRSCLESQGIDCTTGALGAAIGGFGIMAVPESLVQSTIKAASASVTSAPVSVGTFLLSMKIPIVAALLIGLVVPFSLGESPGSGSRPTAAATQAATTPVLPPEVPPIIAEWRKFRAEYGPPDGSMSGLFEAVQALPASSVQRSGFEAATISEWSERDPANAVAYFEAEKETAYETFVLRHWLKKDPAAATAAMAEGSSFLKEFVLSYLLEDVARVAPESLLQLTKLVGETGFVRNGGFSQIQIGFAKGAVENLDGMLAVAEKLDGPARREAFAGIAATRVEKNVDAALNWARSIEPMEDRTSVLFALYRSLAKTDPSLALQYLGDIQGSSEPGFYVTEAASEIIRVAGSSDFDAMLNWLAERPLRLKEQENGLVDPLKKRFEQDPIGTLITLLEHPAQEVLTDALVMVIRYGWSDLGNREKLEQAKEMWGWLASKKRSDFTTRVKGQLISVIARKEPEFVIGQLAELTQNGTYDRTLTPAVVKGLLHTYATAQDIEELIRQTPRELHHELIAESFRRLPQIEINDSSGLTQSPVVYFVNPNALHWRPLLKYLSGEELLLGVRTLGQLQVRTDPVGAIEWIESLDPEIKPAGHYGVASGWANADSYACSQWIANLPPGPARDHATLAMVEQIASAEPDSAWSWALTIEQPEEQLSALKFALEPLFPSEPAFCQELVEKAPLAQNVKTTLEEWIASGAKIERTLEPKIEQLPR